MHFVCCAIPLEGTTHCKGSSTARIRPEQDDMEESSAIRPLPPGPPPPTADAQTQLHSQILLAKQLSTWQLCNLQEAQRSPNRQASTPCFCLAPPVYLPPNKSSSPYQLYKLKVNFFLLPGLDSLTLPFPHSIMILSCSHFLTLTVTV